METNHQLMGRCALREASAVASVLGRYALTVVPAARVQTRAWRQAAQAIPDPVLRALAGATHDEEKLNAEAAAVFALVAPRSRRRTVLRLCAAFQLMYDYLDTLGEQPCADPLANGVRLHGALAAVFDADARDDWYALHSRHDDGGYLRTLVTACRSAFDALPSADAVRPVARRAAIRCGDAQSLTHASDQAGGRLTAWAQAQAGADTLRWWEIAAGGISSIAVLALFAAAADPRTTRTEAERIDAAYFPAACAFSSLLDSLVDRERDAGSGEFASIAAYSDDRAAAVGLAAIAHSSARDLRALRRGRVHLAILNGIAGYYLSANGAGTPSAAPVSAAVVTELRPLIGAVLTTMRLRRRFA